MIQKTLVLIKPDGVKRSLTGRILQRFEDAGLKIVAMRMQWIDKDFAGKHYTEDIALRRGEQVRKWLIDYVTEGPIFAMVLEGVNAVDVVRKIVGTTEPAGALPGTIRGDFAHISYAHADSKQIPIKNLIHASGNAEEAKQEVALWFNEKEIHEYKTVHEELIY